MNQSEDSVPHRERSDTPERAAAHTDAQLVEDYVFFTARRERGWRWTRQHGEKYPEQIPGVQRVCRLCSEGIQIVCRELAQRGRLDLLPDPFEC